MGSLSPFVGPAPLIGLTPFGTYQPPSGLGYQAPWGVPLATSLDFSSATTTYGNCGSAASLDNPTTATIIAWFLPVTGGGKFLMSKYNPGPEGLYNFFYGNVGLGDGQIAFEITRATQSLKAESNTNQVSTTLPQFAAMTFNTGGANGDQHIYVGGQNRPAAEVTYNVQRAGSGAVNDDSGADFIVGLFMAGGGGFEDPLRRIVHLSMYLRQMPLTEINNQRLHRYPAPGCVLFLEFGQQRLGTHRDWSGRGNACVINGTPGYTTSIPRPSWQVGA